MAQRHLLQKDGVFEHALYFEDGQVITEERLPARHTQALLDHAHYLREHAPRRRNSGLGKHAAQVPGNLWHQWRKEWRKKQSQDVSWDTFLAMKLNSPDYRKFLTGVKKL